MSAAQRRLVVPVLAVLLAACAPPMGGQARGGPGGPGGFPPDNRPQYLNPGTLSSIEGFTNAVKIGSTVYVSGQVALDDQGAVVGPGDLKAQAQKAFANLSYVLHLAGATPEEVTRLTVYVVNLKPGDFEVIRAAAPEFFPQRNPPAGVVVGIQALPKEGLLIAVDGTAVIRAMFRPIR